MRVLINVLGSCLVAAGTMSGALYSGSSAVAADAAANHAGEPWWSNPPTADHGYAVPATGSGSKVTQSAPSAGPRSGPKVTEYAPPIAPHSESKVREIAPPGSGAGTAYSGSTAELAPDPPSPQHLHQETLPAAFQQDSAPAAEKTKADDAAQPATSKPLPATPGAAHGVPLTPAEAPSPPAAQQESATPLGLGSGHQVPLVGAKNVLGKSSPFTPLITVGGSLAIVLGLFFLVAWAMRKTAPRGSLVLPKEVFEILGRAPLGARQQVQLLRCGNKLLLVSITPGGTETLTEVTDPLEVDRIAGICQQAHPKSSTTAFRQVFQQLAPKSGEPADLDHLPPAGTRRKRYRWEEEHA